MRLRLDESTAALARRAALTTVAVGVVLAAGLVRPGPVSADPPVAAADTKTVNEDALATTIDVLANDTTTGNITILSATDPAHGTVVVAGNGASLTYAPDANFNGEDTFNYTLEDAEGQASASVVVTVNPVNDPPVAVNDPGVACQPPTWFGGSFPIPEDYGDTFVLFGTCGLLANDSDIDGDELTWEIVDNASHGEATFVDDDFFGYQPDPNYSTLAGDVPGGTWLSDSFTYRASDGVAFSNVATMKFWVAPINDPPTFTPGPDTVTVDEDSGAYSAAWATNVVAGPANESAQTVAFDVMPADIALFSVQPAISSSGVLTFTPAPSASGVATLSIYAQDNGGLVDFGSGNYPPPDNRSDTVQFDIRVGAVNDPPIAVDDEANAVEDGPVVVIGLTDNDSDPDSESFGVKSVAQAEHGSVSKNGNNAIYVPDEDWNGTDTFTYIVWDDDGAESTATVTVTIQPTNDAPQADNDAATVPEDQARTISVLIGDVDIDGDSVQITAKTNGTKGTVSIAQDHLSVRYTPAPNANGADTFTYTISDGHGGTDTAVVNVTITPVNDAPTATNDSAPITAAAGPTAVTVLENDTASPDQGETLSITAVTQPSHGVVAITGGGSGLTYDPAGTYEGADQFTYTISDGHGGTDTATVSVTVAPDILPPVASGPRVLAVGRIGSSSVRAIISWSATDNFSGITLYQVQAQVDGGAWTTITLPTSTTTQILRTLPGGHTYRYRVRAKDAAGNVGAYVLSRLYRL